MMRLYHLITFQLLFYVCSVALVTVTQQPKFLPIEVGESAELHCNHDDSSYLTIYWYRQGTLTKAGAATRGLTLLVTSISGNTPTYEGEFENEYKEIRHSITNSTLKINSVRPEHSGLYLCAAQTRSYEAQHFGEGTKLTVLEREILQPKVSIFEPSIKEIKQKKKATLVCVAYDFYPDHVSITWKMNGVAAVEGNFKTDDYPAKNDNLYSMSSRLRVHSSDYLNHEKRFQCIVNFMLNDANVTTTVREIPGKEACGVTPELHHKETNSAKFIYLLLLSKSSLYGFIILMVIIWHGKVSSDKNFK